jgi:hypothetical protein
MFMPVGAGENSLGSSSWALAEAFARAISTRTIAARSFHEGKVVTRERWLRPVRHARPQIAGVG